MYLWLVWLWLPTGWSLDTQFLPHPLRGSHVRATRFRPALVLKQGCDGAKFEYAYICVYDGVRWSDDSDIFLVVPTQSESLVDTRDSTANILVELFMSRGCGSAGRVALYCSEMGQQEDGLLIAGRPNTFALELGIADARDITAQRVAIFRGSRQRKNQLSRRYEHTKIRARIDEFQAILLAHPQHVNVSLYDAYYTWGDILALPGPSAYDHVPGKSFTVNGLGPCGRPVAVSAKRPALVWVRSRVPERCSQPLEASTNVQFVVLYAGETSQPPLVQCSGSTNPPESCSRGDCIYRVTISKDCLRKGEMAKVVLRQMWRGKTDVLIESLAVGYLTATDGVVYASIDGAPMAFLSDAETLVLNGSGSVHLEGAPLFFNWSCEQCDKNGSLYQAFAKKRLDQQVIEIPDELRYGVSQEYRFVLHVSADGHSDRATITVWVPGDEDDKMVLSCPCCEFGVLSSEDLVIEARPQRTKVWDTRYPLVTWTISGPGGWLTEQRGAVLLLPAGNIVRSGLYRYRAGFHSF
ncbi:hypothetical protein HPB51_000113 [Rhipicephalus microplus]|uniref:Uncharacterized protein n=1 Tax=Rhipicephalus microplus TaxID=6941 RepID=A0A9J6EJI9_RHIMP|nr:hypothetical protein HPB51_000113 [Rhipicephalus microplus]